MVDIKITGLSAHVRTSLRDGAVRSGRTVEEEALVRLGIPASRSGARGGDSAVDAVIHEREEIAVRIVVIERPEAGGKC